jgi:predicted  nucleic acid-binding Zn-ribbon protein
LFCVGCNNVGPEKTAESLQDTRAAVVKAQGDVNETLAALDDLSNTSGDLKPAYARFQKALETTRMQKQTAEARATALRTNQAAYENKWQSDAQTMSNPDVKSSADQRLGEVHDKYGEMRDVAQDCRKQYAYLYTDLLDINQYLSNDLTPAGVQKIKPQIDKAKQDGAALNTRLNDLTTKMDALSGELKPAAAQKS